MTSEQSSTSNQLVTEGWAGYNVIAVSFEEDRNAYNALTALKELDLLAAACRVQEAVVVVRGEDGRFVEKDQVESMSLPSTAGGGLPVAGDRRRDSVRRAVRLRLAVAEASGHGRLPAGYLVVLIPFPFIVGGAEELRK